ncbi:beta/gamma crystallin domain-containing protein [Streptomyces sp. NPDC088745]|uniref:beta/gamma crystallin domain-containing protein n=1 Tax=Streptomyces sp. NPDC088745 TaxID=3365884 RepID=UPI0038062CDD
MKRTISRLGLVLTVGATTALVSVSPAAAVNQTACGDRTDLVKVWFDGDRTACFANAGVMAPGLPRVSRVTSGNNHIEILLGDHVRVLPKWSGIRDVEGLGATLHILQIR